MKLSHSKTNTGSPVGIAYYSREQYEILLKISDDVENMCDTWEEWQGKAIELMNRLSKQGVKVQKIEVYVHQLWYHCSQNGLKNTSATRSQYVQGIVSGVIKP